MGRRARIRIRVLMVFAGRSTQLVNMDEKVFVFKIRQVYASVQSYRARLLRHISISSRQYAIYSSSSATDLCAILQNSKFAQINRALIQNVNKRKIL